MNQENTNTGLWIAGGFLALATAVFFTIKNKGKKESKEADRATEDITDIETQQAMRLKTLMNVNDNFRIWSVDDVDDVDEICNLYNIMLEITNWAKVQQKFNALCKGEYTLVKALQEACKDDFSVYENAIKLAGAPKCVTTVAVKFPAKSEDGDNSKTIDIQANTNVGALSVEYPAYYRFINCYIVTGVYGFRKVTPLYGEISNKYVKLV